MARCLFWYNLIVQVLFGLVMINETSPYEKSNLF